MTKAIMNFNVCLFFSFESQEADVVKIQAFWRAKKAKKDYTQLGWYNNNWCTDSGLIM